MNDDFEYTAIDPLLGSVRFSVRDDVIAVRTMDGILGQGSFSIVFYAKDQGWDDISSEDDLRNHAERWLADVEERAGIALASIEIVMKRKMRGVKS